MRKISTLLLLILYFAQLHSQTVNTYDNSKSLYTPEPLLVMDKFSQTGSSGAHITWNNFIRNTDGSYVFVLKAPVPFTSFGVGWDVGSTHYAASEFEIKYRARTPEGIWGNWYAEDGYVRPEETPTGLYWTDLLFLNNEEQHTELHIFFYVPEGLNLQLFKLSLIDITGTGTGHPEPIDINDMHGIQNCPPFPAIIPRSQWCGSYNACHNTTSYSNISPTHTVVHHGASPDTYSDGAAVVRSYWNYHVNTLGWSDIGYNYLFCKTGNFYQGRHNPNLPNTDVRGAHAGNANNGSIGVNFLGNADVTLPTTAQLDKLKAFFAWWYNHKGFDPTSSASMTTQAYGVQVKPRICGHRDIGQTSCPGNTLYNHLPSIRTGTKAIIDACGSPPPPTGPTNLLATLGACPAPNVVFSWTNSGTGWYILLADNQAFTSPYIKWVSGLTSQTGPAGFVLQSNSTTPLTLVEGTTYYWKIWDGSTFTNGPAFNYPICDNIPPVTSISTSGNWKTEDFTASFTDTDNPGGSGVARRYYQVIDFDGNRWGANTQRGFFADNFVLIDTALWSVPPSGGTWSIINNTLVQSDEAINNTNIYAPLNQNLSNRYLYHFTAKVEGAGHANGRRFGMHYFADNGALSNRGNSYFVWFRIETNKLEFYKVTNNVFSLESVIDDIVTTPGTLYDYKVIFDRITGESYVFRNDSLIGYWKDQQPFSSGGQYISFRTGNSKLTVNELKVYRTRASSVLVTVGNDSLKDMRYENTDPNTIAAKIKSIVIDSANNVSPIAYHDVNVDYTPPLPVAYVNDGTGADTDTVYTLTELSANWAATIDTNSGIHSYWYAIGTTPGDSNIVGWTHNGVNTSVTHSGLNLTFGMQYHISVKARNHAGLYSDFVHSNGALVYSPAGALAANFFTQNTMLCEGQSTQFFDQSLGADSFEWVFYGGTPAVSTQPDPIVTYDTPGVYDVELRVFDPMNNSDTLVLTQYITVHPAPSAMFSVFDSLVYLPNAIVYFSNNSLNANTYLWSFGDTYISTDANPWHQYNAAGIYTVKLVASNADCGSDTLTMFNYITVLDPSSINEEDSGISITLLHNPVGENIDVIISLDSSKWLRFELMDVLGKSFLLSDFTAYATGHHRITFDVQSAAAGIYYFKITSPDKTQALVKVLKP